MKTLAPILLFLGLTSVMGQNADMNFDHSMLPFRLTSATNVFRVSATTNVCPQPAAGFTPNFNNQNETATTNNNVIVFAQGTLPAVYGGDMIYHETLIHKTAAGDQPVIFPPPYVTNINLTSLGGTYRCTNNSLAVIRIWPGLLTNAWVFPIN